VKIHSPLAQIFSDFIVRYLSSNSGRNIDTRGKMFFGFLLFAVLTTLARCIFRTDELKEGYTSGSLISNESLFIGLEGV
jgi:mannose/fructose/N-acetylgalactosamine-specific phosphotransferase system component IID